MRLLSSELQAAWRNSQRLRFVTVGVYNTVFGYACFAALFLLLGSRLHYLFVQLIAHFLSVCNAFYWHRRVTFLSLSPWFKEYLRFNLSYLGALVFGLVLMPVMVAGFGLHPLLAAAIVMFASVILTYVLHTKYSFRPLDKSNGVDRNE